MNLSRPTTIPRQSGASTANWVGETVASTLSGINLTQITLTPKAITAQVQYSKLLLMESDPSIDALLRSDITEQLGLAIDLAALHGTGGTQPTGIIGTSGIGSVLLATNGLSLANSTAYPFLVSLESVVAAANADSNSFAYLMRSNVRGMLKGQSRFSSTDTPVFETVNINGELVGRVNGYKALVSNQIANNLTEGTATTQTTPIFAGCWDDLIVASFGATEIIADQFSAASQRIIKLYAHRFCDVAVRRPQSFCIGSGILGG